MLAKSTNFSISTFLDFCASHFLALSGFHFNEILPSVIVRSPFIYCEIFYPIRKDEFLFATNDPEQTDLRVVFYLSCVNTLKTIQTLKGNTPNFFFL